MINEKEMNEIESSIKNIKNEAFRKEITVYQEKISNQFKESTQLQNENDKLEKTYIQLSNIKYKAIEDLIGQKKQLSLLQGEIEMKQNYLSSLIKAESENDHKKNIQSENIIKLINQISLKENNINQLIKKVPIEGEMAPLLQHPKETEYYLKQILS